jgi:hypothetical protein
MGTKMNRRRFFTALAGLVATVCGARSVVATPPMNSPPSPVITPSWRQWTEAGIVRKPAVFDLARVRWTPREIEEYQKFWNDAVDPPPLKFVGGNRYCYADDDGKIVAYPYVQPQDRAADEQLPAGLRTARKAPGDELSGSSEPAAPVYPPA